MWISLDKKIIVAVINKNHGTEKFADNLIRDFGEIHNIRQLLNDAQQESKQLRDKYQKDMDRITDLIRTVQKNCTHLASTYHADAAGGSDSFTECDICGKEL